VISMGPNDTEKSSLSPLEDLPGHLGIGHCLSMRVRYRLVNLSYPPSRQPPVSVAATGSRPCPLVPSNLRRTAKWIGRACPLTSKAHPAVSSLPLKRDSPGDARGVPLSRWRFGNVPMAWRRSGLGGAAGACPVRPAE
jgi:hypothetical protein